MYEPILVGYWGSCKFLRKIVSIQMFVWGLKNGKIGVMICFSTSNLITTTINLLKNFHFNALIFHKLSLWQIQLNFCLPEWINLLNFIFIFSLLPVENIHCNFTVYLFWYDKLKKPINLAGWRRNVGEIDIIV